MFKIIAITCASLGACAPIAQQSAPKPACTGATVMLPDRNDGPLTCDVRPPQVLGYFVDDPGPIQDAECATSGGTMTTFDGREACVGIDY